MDFKAACKILHIRKPPSNNTELKEVRKLLTKFNPVSNDSDELQIYSKLTEAFLFLWNELKETKNELQQLPPNKLELNLTLEEIFNGCVKKETINRKIIDQNGNETFENVLIKVPVDPGSIADTQIKIEKSGNVEYGKIQANLIFVVKELPHSTFRRIRQFDIEYRKLITFDEAIMDTEFEIPTLEKELISLPNVSRPIKKGDEIVIPNKGLPIRGQNRKRGNMIVVFDFVKDDPSVFPINITLEQIVSGYTKIVTLDRKVIDSAGKKQIQPKRFKIKIEPDSKVGIKYVYELAGNYHQNKMPGDVIFVISTKPFEGEHEILSKIHNNYFSNLLNQIATDLMFKQSLATLSLDSYDFIRMFSSVDSKEFKNFILHLFTTDEMYSSYKAVFEIIDEMSKYVEKHKLIENEISEMRKQKSKDVDFNAELRSICKNKLENAKEFQNCTNKNVINFEFKNEILSTFVTESSEQVKIDYQTLILIFNYYNWFYKIVAFIKKHYEDFDLSKQTKPMLILGSKDLLYDEMASHNTLRQANDFNKLIKRSLKLTKENCQINYSRSADIKNYTEIFSFIQTNCFILNVCQSTNKFNFVHVACSIQLVNQILINQPQEQKILLLDMRSSIHVYEMDLNRTKSGDFKIHQDSITNKNKSFQTDTIFQIKIQCHQILRIGDIEMFVPKCDQKYVYSELQKLNTLGYMIDHFFNENICEYSEIIDGILNDSELYKKILNSNMFKNEKLFNKIALPLLKNNKFRFKEKEITFQNYHQHKSAILKYKLTQWYEYIHKFIVKNCLVKVDQIQLIVIGTVGCGKFNSDSAMVAHEQFEGNFYKLPSQIQNFLIYLERINTRLGIKVYDEIDYDYHAIWAKRQGFLFINTALSTNEDEIVNSICSIEFVNQVLARAQNNLKPVAILDMRKHSTFICEIDRISKLTSCSNQILVELCDPKYWDEDILMNFGCENENENDEVKEDREDEELSDDDDEDDEDDDEYDEFNDNEVIKQLNKLIQLGYSINYIYFRRKFVSKCKKAQNADSDENNNNKPDNSSQSKSGTDSSTNKKTSNNSPNENVSVNSNDKDNSNESNFPNPDNENLKQNFEDILNRKYIPSVETLRILLTYATSYEWNVRVKIVNENFLIKLHDIELYERSPNDECLFKKIPVQPQMPDESVCLSKNFVENLCDQCSETHQKCVNHLITCCINKNETDNINFVLLHYDGKKNKVALIVTNGNNIKFNFKFIGISINFYKEKIFCYILDEMAKIIELIDHYKKEIYDQFCMKLTEVAENTRPDIYATVNILNSYDFSEGKTRGMTELLIGYLENSKSYKFVLNPINGLSGYSDGSSKSEKGKDSNDLSQYISKCKQVNTQGESDQLNEDLVRSHIGFFISLHKCPVAWSSRRVQLEKGGNANMELIAKVMAAEKIVQINELQKFILENHRPTATIYVDYWDDIPTGKKMKRIIRRQTEIMQSYYLRLADARTDSSDGDRKRVKFHYTSRNNNFADTFTKPLHWTEIDNYRDKLYKIGLSDVSIIQDKEKEEVDL